MRTVDRAPADCPLACDASWVVAGDDDRPRDRGENGMPKPVNSSGGSAATSPRHVNGADRPLWSTATKSMAYDDPNAVVP